MQYLPSSPHLKVWVTMRISVKFNCFQFSFFENERQLLFKILILRTSLMCIRLSNIILHKL